MQEDGLIVSNRSRKVNLPPLDVEDHKKRRSGRVSKEVFPEQAKAGSRGGRGKMDSPQEAPTTVIVRPIKKGGESYDDLGGKANGTALQSASAASLKSQVKDRTFKDKFTAVVDGRIVTLIMLLATFYALFFDDIRILAVTSEGDSAVSVVTFVVFCLFLIELVLFSILKKDAYLGKFFFWLDLVATISLVLDVDFIMGPIEDAIYGTDDSGSAVSSNIQEQTVITRASRAARAGTRAGRIVRMVRVIRMVRIFKLWTIVKGNRENHDQVQAEEMADADPEYEPSNIYKKLSDLTSRKIIIGVLIMLFVIPQLDYDTSLFVQPTSFGGPSIGLDTMEGYFDLYQSGVMSQTSYLSESEKVLHFMMQESVSDYFGVQQIKLLKLVSNLTGIEQTFNTTMMMEAGANLRVSGASYTLNWTLSHANLTNTLRDDEVTYVTSTTGNLAAAYNNLYSTKVKAIMGIVQTIFIIILLGGGAAFFSRDFNKLVIHPIERMVDMVKTLAKDPFMTLKTSQPKSGEDNLEIGFIETTLVKIGRLLQIGLGEAGSSVIAANMAHAGGGLNAMVPGNKINAIFGFCDIRQFTDTTECLQEEVMIFVNAIADIVHQAVHRNGGAPNKNIGDAFLVAWRMEGRRGSISTPVRSAATEMADGALKSFLETVKEIDTNEYLNKLVKHPAILKRFGSYTVRLGFGLHIGWAIEGAIGSNLKVDASYLSPNVNLAARLEAATKQYGMMHLLSGEFVSLLSPRWAARCRKIDVVTVKGSAEPMELWTYDVRQPKRRRASGSVDVTTIGSSQKGEDVAHENGSTMSGKKLDSASEFEDILDPPSEELLEYHEVFKAGIDKYISGDWAGAKVSLSRCQEMWTDDRPTQVILDVMEEHGFQSPSWWNGFRELTEK
uniref:Guanylate cyclase domain-containing protein n=1 Tax=Palpitomonas bilix TaxID=652834 RepID=A0A7S3D7F0_9EUKA|mmetsp:Transcript_25605/g.64313  ORF Transcript_25605/g.64313 Transcript_25605/m.64313 type:complete len:894 (+) Transcript_25605:73-2754(+)